VSLRHLSQVGSGQARLLYSARIKDHGSHNLKAAWLRLRCVRRSESKCRCLSKGPRGYLGIRPLYLCQWHEKGCSKANYIETSSCFCSLERHNSVAFLFVGCFFSLRVYKRAGRKPRLTCPDKASATGSASDYALGTQAPPELAYHGQSMTADGLCILLGRTVRATSIMTDEAEQPIGADWQP
jgi:hypothetical protein